MASLSPRPSESLTSHYITSTCLFTERCSRHECLGLVQHHGQGSKRKNRAEKRAVIAIHFISFDTAKRTAAVYSRVIPCCGCGSPLVNSVANHFASTSEVRPSVKPDRPCLQCGLFVCGVFCTPMHTLAYTYTLITLPPCNVVLWLTQWKCGVKRQASMATQHC